MSPTGPRLIDGTREPAPSARTGSGLAAETGDGWSRGRSLRSSPSAGKPRARRREAGSGSAPTTEERSVDSDYQAEQAWLLGVQRKLYQWSWENPTEPYRDLWNWVTDPRNLRCAWRSIATNKGKRTSGVDGETVESIVSRLGVDAFLDGLRNELRQRSYCPSPARRVWIPKRGKPGKFRPLGIPTVADRVVQCAVKQVLEPIFEARFWHVSYGFRPGRGCHGALEHIRQTIMPRVFG